jgi:hypothetical protein
MHRVALKFSKLFAFYYHCGGTVAIPIPGREMLLMLKYQTWKNRPLAVHTALFPIILFIYFL